jgi:RNA polymerase sigma-54 factor
MIDTGLHLSQSQKLIIGPQMQQSLAILQAATLELRQVIAQEMAVNPVLEMDTPDVSLEDAVPNDPDDFDGTSTGVAQGEGPTLDEAWQEYWSQSRERVTRSEDDEERHRHMMDSITLESTLQEHLLAQLRTAAVSTPEVRDVVEFLIGNLNDNGFLSATLDDISLHHALPIDTLREAQDVLISFDPPGIGAVDLRESLLIQLERLGKRQSLSYRLAEQYLDYLAHKRYQLLSRKLIVPVEQVSRAAEFIGTLDPRPASRFVAMRNHYVSPDVVVERQGGAWCATMTGDDLPRLRISNSYKDMLVAPRVGGDAREYIRDKIKSGKFLIRSIQQRQQTIQRIASEIVKAQPDYFDKGPSFLRPLTMGQVATTLDIHETTVGRAIAGKYITTPHGVREMRYFFTQGVGTAEGEDLASASVKTALSELIAGEPGRKPLSDEKLTQLLNDRGINVARRTVAKYREAMNILPSHLRKSFS